MGGHEPADHNPSHAGALGRVGNRPMSGFDPARAVDALLEARRTRRWLKVLPEGARPASEAEAYAIQDLAARELGAIAGWKVGSATADSEPFRAPIHAGTLFEGGHVPARILHLIGIEAELVYRFGHDLPPRAAPYTRDEVLAAVATMHPAIEIVDTRFVSLAAADALSQRADQQNHGALALGPPRAAWSRIDPPTQPVRLSIDGHVVHEGIGGNSAVDPVRLLVWMADHGARSLGGLRAGQAVTTGSCSGTIFVVAGVPVRAEFPELGTIDITID